MSSDIDSINSTVSLRRCERCGNPTPGELPQCVNCGAISIHAVVEEHKVKAEHHFMRALFSRATPVTYAILAVNLVIYLVMAVVAGGNFFSELINMNDLGTLVAFGAKTNELLRQGEWFRLVTPIFIHGGLLHLASNSYAIWNVGPLVEKIYGSSRYLFIYLLAGIGGVIGSYFGGMARPAWIAGVGASGAIFGLFGALFVFGYKYRHELPQNFRKAVTSGIVPVVIINLFIGFSIPAIDNAAHIGGLISGAALALIIPYAAPGRTGMSRLALATIVICSAIVGYSFFRAYQTSGSHLIQRSIVVQKFLNNYTQGDRAVIEVFDSAFKAADARPVAEAFARLEASRQALENSPAPDAVSEKIRRDMIEQMKLLQEAAAGTRSDSGSDRLDNVAAQIIAIRKRFRDWVSREGFKYGFSLRNSSKNETDQS